MLTRSPWQVAVAGSAWPSATRSTSVGAASGAAAVVEAVVQRVSS